MTLLVPLMRPIVNRQTRRTHIRQTYTSQAKRQTQTRFSATQTYETSQYMCYWSHTKTVNEFMQQIM